MGKQKGLYKIKELSLCHKLRVSNLSIFVTKGHRPQLFQTMNSVRSNNLSLKYQRFTITSSGSKDIGVRKLSLWQRLNSFDIIINFMFAFYTVVGAFINTTKTTFLNRFLFSARIFCNYKHQKNLFIDSFSWFSFYVDPV